MEFFKRHLIFDHDVYAVAYQYNTNYEPTDVSQNMWKVRVVKSGGCTEWNKNPEKSRNEVLMVKESICYKLYDSRKKCLKCYLFFAYRSNEMR